MRFESEFVGQCARAIGMHLSPAVNRSKRNKVVANSAKSAEYRARIDTPGSSLYVFVTHFPVYSAPAPTQASSCLGAFCFQRSETSRTVHHQGRDRDGKEHHEAAVQGTAGAAVEGTQWCSCAQEQEPGQREIGRSHVALGTRCPGAVWHRGGHCLLPARRPHVVAGARDNNYSSMKTFDLTKTLDDLLRSDWKLVDGNCVQRDDFAISVRMFNERPLFLLWKFNVKAERWTLARQCRLLSEAEAAANAIRDGVPVRAPLAA